MSIKSCKFILEAQTQTFDSLKFLQVSVWVSTGRSGFLLQSKDVQVWWIEDAESFMTVFGI